MGRDVGRVTKPHTIGCLPPRPRTAEEVRLTYSSLRGNASKASERMTTELLILLNCYEDIFAAQFETNRQESSGEDCINAGKSAHRGRSRFNGENRLIRRSGRRDTFVLLWS